MAQGMNITQSQSSEQSLVNRASSELTTQMAKAIDLCKSAITTHIGNKLQVPLREISEHQRNNPELAGTHPKIGLR